MTDTQPAEIGHNEPPAPIDKEFEDLESRVSQLKQTANRWANERPEILDDDMAIKVEDFLGQAKAEKTAVENRVKGLTKPLRDEAAAIRAQHAPLVKVCETIIEVLNPIKQRWLEKKEAERQAQLKREKEEAEQAEREAAEAIKKAEEGTGDVIGNAIAADAAQDVAADAQKKVQDTARTKTSIKGDYTARASGLRKYWVGEITDIDAVFERYRDNEKVIDCLHKLVNADVRGGARRIKGVKIEEKTRV